MQFRFGLSIAVLLVAAATRGHADLQCYVCDNCAKIDKSTPLEMCGPATVTTVTTPAELSSVSTTTSTTTTTTAAPVTTTEEHTTQEQTTASSTAFPTPPTVGPTSSTTGLPTPPNVGPVAAETFDVVRNFTESALNATAALPTTVYFVTPSHEGSTTVEPTVIVTPMHNHTTEHHNGTVLTTQLLRQRRNVPVDGTTYHCFRVEKKYNGVYGIQRGCMAVQTEQSVCGELKAANNNQTKKCHPCSTSMCNSSSTLGVSIATVLVALVALVYRV